MTRKPKGDRAVIKAFRLRELAKAQASRDALDKLVAEYEQLLAEHAEIEREMNKRVFPWPISPGRPGKWNNAPGGDLVVSVRDIRAANKCSKREAIGLLKKQQPDKWGAYKIYKDGHEELESKLNEAEKYWLPLVKRFERVGARLAELEAKLKESGQRQRS